MKVRNNRIVSEVFYFHKNGKKVCNLHHNHGQNNCKPRIILEVLNQKERTVERTKSLFMSVTSSLPHTSEQHSINLRKIPELAGVFDSESYVRIDRRAKDLYELSASEIALFQPRTIYLTGCLSLSSFITILEEIKNHSQHLTKFDLMDLDDKIQKLKTLK